MAAAHSVSCGAPSGGQEFCDSTRKAFLPDGEAAELHRCCFFCPAPEQKVATLELVAPLPRLRTPHVMLFRSSCGVAGRNVDAFLLNAGIKSLGGGAFCSDIRAWKGNAEAFSSDAGSKTLAGSVLRLAQEAMGAASEVPGTDGTAQSIGRGR